ncbi:(S)-ureidoglycine aminohydrolase [Clostridium sp. AM58-1XD]|uniref:(S)-ureidoglycine aminohydrolase n=1 Tax=Clostridium sp. AM58-1XD TaxID=2292307 RepID=UPI000E4B1E81|nr:(S)-ureidoglycine aminohydrolase [Clostridium sp. AM58-1XD]RGY97506.1 (S)-ureidoglycine aminohydrolase [Clostridium sp. AM58-1XD]
MNTCADILTTRAKVKKGSYALVPPVGPVTNMIPEMENCQVYILAARELGADFIQYYVQAEPGCGTNRIFAGEKGIEAFVFVLEGTCVMKCCGQSFQAAGHSFLSSPPGAGIEFVNDGDHPVKLLIQTRRYIPLEGTPVPSVLFGNADDVEAVMCDGKDDNVIRELIPQDLSYDIQMSVITFYPGASHTFLECHFQEHGLYCLEGAASYMMSDTWTMIKKDDFLWIGAFVPHGCYCAGNHAFSYLYSKVVNRTPAL